MVNSRIDLGGSKLEVETGVQVKRRSEVVAIPTALGVVVKTGGQPAQVEKVAYALSHSDML